MKTLAALLATLLAVPSLAAENGAALYKAKCASCHGDKGKADTPVGKALKVTPIAGTPMPVDDIVKTARDGIPGTKMVPIKGLTTEQLQAIAKHVKSLK